MTRTVHARSYVLSWSGARSTTRVLLKMSKSWFGFSSIKCFGYKVTMERGRWARIARRPLWSSAFLPLSEGDAELPGRGAVLQVICSQLLQNRVGVEQKMTHKDFNWKRESWTYDYESDFERMKKPLSESVANHFPDYNLDWVLRVDASVKAVGAVLYQERPD